MERLITFCVLLCLSSLVAALPFPDPFPEGYEYEQQPYMHYNNVPQSQPLRQRPQYGQVGTYPSEEPTYVGNSYRLPSNNARNYHGFESPTPPRKPFLPLTQQQIQEHIEEQIQEHALNERLTNGIRTQNVQPNQAIHNVAEPSRKPYLPHVPTQQQIQEQIEEEIQEQALHERLTNGIRTQTASQVSHLKPAFVYEQQLPEIQTPSHQWRSSPVAYEHGSTAQSHSAVKYSAPEPAPRPANTYQGIYNHFVQQQQQQQQHQQPRPSTGVNHQAWQNIWNKYSNNGAPPKHEKRYLVIHPDGSTEYVDKIESIAEKHPNYLLVNKGSIGPNVAPSVQNSPISGAPAPGTPLQTVPGVPATAVPVTPVASAPASTATAPAAHAQASAVPVAPAPAATAPPAPVPTAPAAAATPLAVPVTTPAPTTPAPTTPIPAAPTPTTPAPVAPTPASPTPAATASAATATTATASASTAPAAPAPASSTPSPTPSSTPAPTPSSTPAPTPSSTPAPTPASSPTPSPAPSAPAAPAPASATASASTAPATPAPASSTPAPTPASSPAPSPAAPAPSKSTPGPANANTAVAVPPKSQILYLGSLTDTSAPKPIDSAILKKILGGNGPNEQVIFISVQPQPTLLEVIHDTLHADGSIHRTTKIAKKENENSQPIIVSVKSEIIKPQKA